MEIIPVSYLDIRLHSTIEENEVKQFMDFVKRAYMESARPGLKNMFENDRPILKKLMEELKIQVEREDIKTTI